MFPRVGEWDGLWILCVYRDDVTSFLGTVKFEVAVSTRGSGMTGSRVLGAQ